MDSVAEKQIRLINGSKSRESLKPDPKQVMLVMKTT
jgi:hypothetical protein